MSIRFCDQCNNMMYPEESLTNTLQSVLLFCCHNEDCKHTEEQPEENYCIQRNQIISKPDDELPSEIILKGLKDDPTLSKESMVCKNPGCDGREARLLHQTKGEDQGLREFLICCECGKVYEKNTN